MVLAEWGYTLQALQTHATEATNLQRGPIVSGAKNLKCGFTRCSSLTENVKNQSSSVAHPNITAKCLFKVSKLSVIAQQKFQLQQKQLEHPDLIIQYVLERKNFAISRPHEAPNTHPGESSSSKMTVSTFSAFTAVATWDTFPAPT